MRCGCGGGSGEGDACGVSVIGSALHEHHKLAWGFGGKGCDDGGGRQWRDSMEGS